MAIEQWINVLNTALPDDVQLSREMVQILHDNGECIIDWLSGTDAKALAHALAYAGWVYSHELSGDDIDYETELAEIDGTSYWRVANPV